MRTSNIPDSNLKNKTVKNNGNTNDIVNVILKQDKKFYPDFKEFSKKFNGRSGLEKLVNFVKYEIKYKIDPSGQQIVKSPMALWKLRKGDCKSKTIFVNQVLKHLQIPCLPPILVDSTGYPLLDLPCFRSLFVRLDKMLPEVDT